MKKSNNLVQNDWLDGIKLRQTTENMVNNFLWDLPLTPAQCQDFGIESANHYRALRAALFNDPDNVESLSNEECRKQLIDRVKELDKALGSGPKITAFVQKYAPEYELEFETPFDALRIPKFEK